MKFLLDTLNSFLDRRYTQLLVILFHNPLEIQEELFHNPLEIQEDYETI